MKISFVTSNKNKLIEFQKILDPIQVVQLSYDIPELQGSPEEIARSKAHVAYQRFGIPLFVEDTSLHLNALGGLPGPYIKHFIGKIGCQGIVDMLKGFEDKGAVAKTTIGIALGKKTGTATGEMRGTIVEPRGESTFGFDPIFLPEGEEKTYAQMSADEKNNISHRRKAIDLLKEALSELQTGE